MNTLSVLVLTSPLCAQLEDEHLHEHNEFSSDTHSHGQDDGHDHSQAGHSHGDEQVHLHESDERTPEIGAVIDVIIDHRETDNSTTGDGSDLNLRTLGLTANAWIAPNAWAYAILVADEDDVVLEEAAMHVSELAGPFDLRVGRFFVDFGRQMQSHVHDLPYPERPAVLREYLGNELGATGIQLDHSWISEETKVRFSFGLFDSLLDTHDHGGGGHQEEEAGGEAEVPARGGIDELNWTARLTGVHSAGENSEWQWGVSHREIPKLAFHLESSDFEVEDLSNSILGIDLAYRTGEDMHHPDWSVGAEALFFSGDIGTEVNDSGTPLDPSDDTLSVFNDDATGYYTWIEKGLESGDSIGALYSAFEHPEMGLPEDKELTLYYSRNFTHSWRMRLGVSHLDSAEGNDQTALMVQFTSFLGPHNHGTNW